MPTNTAVAPVEPTADSMLAELEKQQTLNCDVVVPSSESAKTDWPTIPKKGDLKKGELVDDNKPGHLKGADRRIDGFNSRMTRIEAIIRKCSLDSNGKANKLDYTAKQIHLDGLASITAVVMPVFEMLEAKFDASQKK